MQVLEMRKWFEDLKKNGKWDQSLFKTLVNLTNYQRAKGLIHRLNFSQTLVMIYRMKNINLIFRFLVHYTIFKIFKNNIFEKNK